MQGLPVDLPESQIKPAEPHRTQPRFQGSIGTPPCPALNLLVWTFIAKLDSPAICIDFSES